MPARIRATAALHAGRSEAAGNIARPLAAGKMGPVAAPQFCQIALNNAHISLGYQPVVTQRTNAKTVRRLLDPKRVRCAEIVAQRMMAAFMCVPK